MPWDQSIYKYMLLFKNVNCWLQFVIFAVSIIFLYFHINKIGFIRSTCIYFFILPSLVKFVKK